MLRIRPLWDRYLLSVIQVYCDISY